MALAMPTPWAPSSATGISGRVRTENGYDAFPPSIHGGEQVGGARDLNQQLAVRQRQQRLQRTIARQRRHGGTFGVQGRGRLQEILETSSGNVRIVRLGLDCDDVIDRFDVAKGSGRL